jgi:hypothetical protein
LRWSENGGNPRQRSPYDQRQPRGCPPCMCSRRRPCCAHVGSFGASLVFYVSIEIVVATFKVGLVPGDKVLKHTVPHNAQSPCRRPKLCAFPLASWKPARENQPLHGTEEKKNKRGRPEIALPPITSGVIRYGGTPPPPPHTYNATAVSA